MSEQPTQPEKPVESPKPFVEAEEITLSQAWNEEVFQALVKKINKMKDKERVEAILRDLNKLALYVKLHQQVALVNVQNFKQIKAFMEETDGRLKRMEAQFEQMEVFNKEDGKKKSEHYTQ